MTRAAWSIEPVPTQKEVPAGRGRGRVAENTEDIAPSPDRLRQMRAEQELRIRGWERKVADMIRDREKLLAEIDGTREWRDTAQAVADKAKDPVVRAEALREVADAEVKLAGLEANVPEHDRSIAWVRTQKPKPFTRR